MGQAGVAPASAAIGSVLSVRQLSVTFDENGLGLRAVDDFNLELRPGGVVGIIGESGSGKTTAVRALIGLLPPAAKVPSGEIRFRDELVFSRNRNRLRTIRGAGIGMIFQSASNSINPLFRIGFQLKETLQAHGRWTSSSKDEIETLLARLGLREPGRVLRSYPHQLSGGMLQRAAIALAVAVSPTVIIADECTSALDVTTQAEVIQVLRTLVEDGRSLVYVTHDLLLASEICTSLIVMYAGRMVETGETNRVLTAPRHPYTRALLDSVPVWGPKLKLRGIPGLPPHVTKDWTGCVFALRCPRAGPLCRGSNIAWTGEPADGFRCVSPLLETTAPQSGHPG